MLEELKNIGILTEPLEDIIFQLDKHIEIEEASEPTLPGVSID